MRTDLEPMKLLLQRVCRQRMVPTMLSDKVGRLTSRGGCRIPTGCTGSSRHSARCTTGNFVQGRPVRAPEVSCAH